MNTIPMRQTDLGYVVARMPSDVRDRVKQDSLIVGGGFPRSIIAGEDPHDIDAFGPSDDALKKSAAALQGGRSGSRLHETENAYTVLHAPRLPVQFIRRWLYGAAQAVVESFDFTVCQAAVWYADEKWSGIVGEDFYPDLAARRLVYTAPKREEAAGGSLMRVRKFVARGYTIQVPSLAGVVTRLVRGIRTGHSTDTIGALLPDDELNCVLVGLLREVDPLAVIDGVELAEVHG